MSESLLDQIKNLFTPELITQASSAWEEKETDVAQGLGAIVPTLLGGLLQQSGDEETVKTLLPLINHADNDISILGSVSSLLSQNPKPLATSIGEQFLSELLGDKLDIIRGTIAKLSGLKSESVIALFGIVAPLLLGLLGKEFRGNATASRLTALLSAQKAHILGALPLGIGSMLGLSSVATGIAGVAGISGDAANKGEALTDVAPTGAPRWLTPGLIGLAVLGTALYFMRTSTPANNFPPTAITTPESTQGSTQESTPAPEASPVPEASPAPAATPAAGTVPELALTDIKLPDGKVLKGAASGIENSLLGFVQDASKAVDKTTWFNFDRLLFDTGKATLKPESDAQLANMVAILKAFPAVNLKIGGYTDNTGDAKANLKLSSDRASAVLAKLTGLGIAKERLAAEGYGDQFPVGNNATEEGRAQNRRIAVRVTQK